MSGILEKTDTVQIIIKGKPYEFPVYSGTFAEKGIDISKLRSLTGYITLDPGYKNTGSTTSQITFIDGEKGQLIHRGYSIEELAENSNFVETIYLVLNGELPNQAQLEAFEAKLRPDTQHLAVLQNILNALPDGSHPMCMLGTLLSSMAGIYPQSLDSWSDPEIRDQSITRLLELMPVMTAYIYRRFKGLEYIAPDPKLGYIDNFLHMMFGEVDSEIAEALDTLLILHADHEQNCSTSAVRLSGSSHVNVFSAIACGSAALWGPLHGGANQAVLEMLEAIQDDGGDIAKYVGKAKDKSDPFRLMGFGHRVYKNYDPRASVIKKYVDVVLDKLNLEDPVLDIARSLERTALEDDYFRNRKIFPNVDFYSGIIYRALGIPVDMFTVMFALGRAPGWISQWKELREDKLPINRPRQIYTGYALRNYESIGNR